MFWLLYPSLTFWQAVVKDLWVLRLQKPLGARKSATPIVEGQADQVVWTGGETNGPLVTTDAETYSSEYLSSGTDVDNAQGAENDQGLLRRNTRLGLMVTLALCYLAAIMIRIPISLGDIHKWVDSQDIPYMLALQEIPENMRQSLNATYIKALRPTVG